MMRCERMHFVVAFGLLIATGRGLCAAENTDEPAERKTLLYIAKHVSAADLARAVAPVLESSGYDDATVVPEPVTNYLLVTADRPALEKVAKVLAQMDRPRKMIGIEVRLIEASRRVETKEEGSEPSQAWDLSGSADEVMAKVRDLEEGGLIEVLDHVKLATLDNVPARIQVGQRKPLVTGVTYARPTSRSSGSSAAGPRFRQVSHEDVGLLVKVTAKSSPDGIVAMNLEIEKSRLSSPEDGVALNEGDDGHVIRTPEVLTSTLETTVSVPDGKMIVAGGLTATSASKQSRLLLLVSGRILQP